MSYFKITQTTTSLSNSNVFFFQLQIDNIVLFQCTRYFGAAKDLPGVRELFEQERKFQDENLL